MATPSFRQRAGMIEIKNKQIKEREERRKREELEENKDISEDEHKKRLNILKDIGLIKNGN